MQYKGINIYYFNLIGAANTLVFLERFLGAGDRVWRTVYENRKQLVVISSNLLEKH